MLKNLEDEAKKDLENINQLFELIDLTYRKFYDDLNN